MTDTKYANVAQQRVLHTLQLLTEANETGVAPGELARRLNTAPSNTPRDLANLRMAGLAIPINGRWFPASRTE